MWGYVAPALAAVSGAAEPIARERVHPGPASSRFLSSPLDTPLRFCPLWDRLLLSGSSLDHSEREKIKPRFLTQRLLGVPEHQARAGLQLLKCAIRCLFLINLFY